MSKIRVLCYGDSNTWGYVPGTGDRQPEDVRWTGICQKELGDAYTVIENGLNGRTTVYNDYFSGYLNGRQGLPYALNSQKPLDLVVLMLGSNDMKFTGAVGAATGADELVRMLLNADGIYRNSKPIFPNGPKVLLIAPPLIAPEINTLFPDSSVYGKAGETARFAVLYENIAKNRDVYFLNAALYAQPSLIDCIHIDAESHTRLGKAIAEKIREIL